MSLTTQAISSTTLGSLDHTSIKTQKTSVDTAGDTDFGAILSNVANQTVTSLAKAESTAVSGLQGKVNAREVTDAVMQAQQNLQIALALRDKSLSAFQELNRMSI